MRSPSRISLAILLLQQFVVTESTQQADASSDTLECGLYLAESTIPHAGLGIFAGHDYRIGQDIGNGDVCIPFIDMYW
jgi:hypothetical protein